MKLRSVHRSHKNERVQWTRSFEHVHAQHWDTHTDFLPWLNTTNTHTHTLISCLDCTLQTHTHTDFLPSMYTTNTHTHWFPAFTVHYKNTHTLISCLHCTLQIEKEIRGDFIYLFYIKDQLTHRPKNPCCLRHMSQARKCNGGDAGVWVCADLLRCVFPA